MSSAWTITLEALSWLELQGMNEEAALRKTFKQIGIKDYKVASKASELVYAVSMRRNALDYLINQTLLCNTVFQMQKISNMSQKHS